MRFEKYHITDEIKKNLFKLGFNRPTDIQYKSIPSIMEGEDVLAIAQTGTGKTAAFAIPVINKIQSNKSSKRSYGIKCIVMVPTRELALQIGDVFNALARHTKVKAFAVYGGVEQAAQIKKLQDGIDVLVATPGRMFDLISQGYIELERVDTLILDEADHMLDLGFIDDIKSVKKMLPRKHQTLFFSATINKEIKKLAFSQVKSSAIRIQISLEDPVSKNVSHFVMFIEMDDKRFFLEKFIKDHPDSKMIVFVRTRVRAERVAKAMNRVRIDALTIHGEKEQKSRSDVMQKFKNSECNLLIATDVSARGIDIDDVKYVINYDLPDKTENYVHRVGRTGRGMKKGIAVSFCSIQGKDLLLEIQQYLNKEIEVIKTSKQEYATTIETTEAEDDIRAMIENYEKLWQRKKKRENLRRKSDPEREPNDNVDNSVKSIEKDLTIHRNVIMTNNDILRRIRFIFDYSDSKMIAIFGLTEHLVNREQISARLKKDDDPAFQKCNDTNLSIFLNGLIIDKRGKKEGPKPKPEKQLNI